MFSLNFPEAPLRRDSQAVWVPQRGCDAAEQPKAPSPAGAAGMSADVAARHAATLSSHNEAVSEPA